jgi:hypothetical protein
MAPLYAGAEGVESASPNWTVGDGSDIQVSLPEYTFKLGWGNCSSGCIYSHYWVFTVIEGSVNLVKEYGSPLPLSIDPEPMTVEAGFGFKISITQDIYEAFDYYLFADTQFGTFTLYFDGRVEKGITPLYRNLSGFNAPLERKVIPNVILPMTMGGKEVTFYAVVVQAGKIPPVLSPSELKADTLFVIMIYKKTVTVAP